MDTNFKQGVTFVLKWEGGYSNDPVDPGGETKFGISKRAYPNEDIKNLTRDRAEELYYRDYWLKAGCDKLEAPLCYVVFDAAVNVGVRRATEWLAVVKANQAELNASKLARLFQHERIGYYNGLVQKRPSMSKYLKGWMNRVNDLSKMMDLV